MKSPSRCEIRVPIQPVVCHADTGTDVIEMFIFDVIDFLAFCGFLVFSYGFCSGHF